MGRKIYEFLGKTFLSFAMWVFVLSLPWDGGHLFDVANRILVRGSWEFVTEKTHNFWASILKNASLEYAKIQEDPHKSKIKQESQENEKESKKKSGSFLEGF